MAEICLGQVPGERVLARVAITEKNKVACASGGAFCRVGCDPARVERVPRSDHLSL